MGVNPDLDDDTVILNPNFDNATHWIIDWGWNIHDGIAHAAGIAPFFGTMRQEIGVRRYFRYRLTFDLLNCIGINPAIMGLKINMGGTLSDLYGINGTYTYEAVATDASGELIFISWALDVLSEFQIDNLVLEKMENYVEDELDVFIREPKRASTFVAVATDYYTSLSCRNDNSSCIISFDLP